MLTRVPWIIILICKKLWMSLQCSIETFKWCFKIRYDLHISPIGKFILIFWVVSLTFNSWFISLVLIGSSYVACCTLVWLGCQRIISSPSKHHSLSYVFYINKHSPKIESSGNVFKGSLDLISSQPFSTWFYLSVLTPLCLHARDCFCVLCLWVTTSSFNY